MRINPIDARAYGYRGIAYNHEHKFDEAMKDLNEAIRLNPIDKESHYQRGLIYAVIGEDQEKAIHDFTETIQLDPKNEKAHSMRGAVYTVSGEWDKAINDLDQAIELNPKDADSFGYRGSAYGGKTDPGPGGERFYRGNTAQSYKWRVFSQPGIGPCQKARI